MTAVVEQAQRRQRSSPWPPAAIVAVVFGWITTVLVLDSNASHTIQRLLGLATWVVLIAVARRETGLVRMQTAVVVVFASLVEFTFSPLLGVYIYRFDNVPMYVPPGHGLVYLAALAIGRTAFVRTRTQLCMTLALVALGGYAIYGLAFAARPDVLGAFWFVCLAGFLFWGPSRGLYIGAAVAVTYLEILGTSLGTWTWQPQDPTGLVPIGNPPSGAAGGYGWFDLAALLLAPTLLGWGQRVSRAARRTRRSSPPPAMSSTSSAD